MALAGAIPYLGVHPDSLKQMIEKLVEIKGGDDDDPIETRFEVIDRTIEKIEANDPVWGGPKLLELIMDIEQCDKLRANRLLNQLKAVWLDDIRHQRLTKQEQDKESGEPIHVHQAFMQQEGPASVMGEIIGFNTPELMTEELYYECEDCGHQKTYQKYDYPIWKYSEEKFRKATPKECEGLPCRRNDEKEK